jgi:hypothetical protein
MILKRNTKPPRTFAAHHVDKLGREFVYQFDTNRIDETLRLIGRHAADPTHSLDWFGAATLSAQVRKLAGIEELAAANG